MRLTLITLIILISGCSSQDTIRNTTYSINFPLNEQKTTSLLVDKPKTISPSHPSGLDELKQLDQVLEVKDILRLTTPDSHLFSRISQLEAFDNSYVILDRALNLVMEFDKNGVFMAPVGRTGQGPGEYQAPFVIKKCFGEKLGILDTTSGKVLLYNEKREFEQEIYLAAPPHQIYPDANFIWKQKNTFVAPYITQNFEATRIVNFNPVTMTPSWGFGKRLDYTRRKGASGWEYSCFEQFNEHYWIASPYSNKVEIYSNQGFLSSSFDLPIKEPLKESDFDEITRHTKKRNSELFTKERPLKFVGTKDLVFIFTGYRYILTDQNGKTLNANLKPAKIRPLLSSKGNEVYSEILPLENKDSFNAHDYEILKQKGYLATIEDDNPYLRISVVKP